MARNRKRDNKRSRPSAREVIAQSMNERKRYTPRDMEDYWKQQSDKAKAATSTAQKGLFSPEGRRALLSVALLGVAGTFAIIGTTQQKALSAEAEAARSETSSLSSQLSDAEAALASPMSPDQGKELISSARTKGEEAARLQNVYIDTDSNDSDALAATAQAESQLFEAPASGASLDPRQPWFVYYNDDGTPVGSGTYSWSFQSPYTFSGTQTSVTWLARDNATGQLLAWTMATYDTTTGTFSKVTTNVTKAGGDRRGSTPPIGTDGSSPDVTTGGDGTPQDYDDDDQPSDGGGEG